MRPDRIIIPILVAIVATFMGIEACTPEPSPPPATAFSRPCESPPDEELTDAGLEGASPFLKACINLKTLGCPEGEKRETGQTCTQTLREVDGLSSIKPSCIIAAKTKDEVRKCNVRCGMM